MIQVTGIKKIYGDKVAVDDVSFTVGVGEIVGLLGPNGAGKSTIMKIINGYIPATDGDVFIDGTPVTVDGTKSASKIGFLPEIPPLYPDMKVIDYLSFMADIKKVPKSEINDHLKEIMDMADIAHVSNRLIKNLSKGYRQRVGLAQALISLPPILILDEPTVGLDPKQRTELRELIIKLSKNHTIMLSSHVLAEVSMICKKIIIINNGKIAAIDSTDNLEKSIEKSDHFILKLKGNKDIAIELLRKMNCIAEEQTTNTESSGISTIDIVRNAMSEKGEKLRSDIFFAFAKADIAIIEMRTVGMTLEEIFLKVISEQEPNIGENL